MLNNAVTIFSDFYRKKTQNMFVLPAFTFIFLYVSSPLFPVTQLVPSRDLTRCRSATKRFTQDTDFRVWVKTL